MANGHYELHDHHVGRGRLPVVVLTWVSDDPKVGAVAVAQTTQERVPLLGDAVAAYLAAREEDR